MADPIPTEEDITKEQLWKRIDHLRDVFESHKGEILYQLETSKDGFKTQVKDLNAEHDMSVQKKFNEVKDFSLNTRNEIFARVEETIKDVDSTMDGHLGEVEQRLKEVREYVEEAVKTQATILFSDDQKEIAEMKKSWDIFSKTLNENITKYMVETRTKVGELNFKVEKVISKLKDGFQDL